MPMHRSCWSHCSQLVPSRLSDRERNTFASQRGFTLIEVMVALVLVAVTLPVFLQSMHGLLDNTSHMRDKTHAYWLAENLMQETMLEHEIKEDMTKTRKREDREEFAGREWYWKIEMEQTAIQEMHRIEITVGLDEDDSMASLSGFLRAHETTGAAGGANTGNGRAQ